MTDFVLQLANLRPVQGLSLACDGFLAGLANRVFSQKMTAQDKEVLYYSGKNFNEVGYYEDCIRKPHMNYWMIQIGVEYLRNPVGICMVDKCNDDDWKFLHDKFKATIDKSLDDPTSALYPAKDYFVLYFDKVYPVDHPGLKDSYAFFFVAFLFTILALVLYSTFYYFAKSKRRYPKNSENELEEEIHVKTNQLEDQRKVLLHRPLLKFFDIRTNIRDASSYVLNHPGQLAADIIHIAFGAFTFIYWVPFIEASISKIGQDKVENDFYNSGPEDSNLQIILFLPEGYLFLTGYLCFLSAVRAFTRIEIGLRKQHWWRLVVCYVKLLVRRYLRLIFGFIFGSIFVWKMIPIVLSGPLKYTQFGCTDDNFFPSLFFINNRVVGNDKRMCASWYYFFAMNFRLYTLLPGIVLLYLFGARKIAASISALLGLASLVYSLVYIQHNNIRETHPYDGSWLAHVFWNTYMHAFSFFFGIICAIGQLTYIDNFKSKFDSRSSESYFDFNAGKDLGSLAGTVAVEPKNASGRIKRNRFWEIIFLVSLVLFSVDYYIYLQYWQNDDVTIKDWPQWRHTIFNTFGILGLAICPIFIVASICFRIDQPLLNLFSNNTVFGLLRSSYYELTVLGVPYLITLFFALQAMPYFDDPMVNGTIVWMTISALAFAVVLHLLIFKPLDNLAARFVGL